MAFQTIPPQANELQSSPLRRTHDVVSGQAYLHKESSERITVGRDHLPEKHQTVRLCSNCSQMVAENLQGKWVHLLKDGRAAESCF
jgi:hypothetical protein